ncbi:hypothetical protein [Streptomyces sp. MBT33]|uniref:hypothetical protein n=1 Tax=Streptomyces sp. MBT33 TaxID=1488363 RepID=UPI00190A6101|nr:hypothetical protein [Streptomyces sp. MBT33]MBK3639293.1 hypothetical protein [Streptomyces sp. MBT33]
MSGTLGTRTGHRVHALVVTAEPAHTDAPPTPAAASAAGSRPCPAEGALDGLEGARAPGGTRGVGSGSAMGPEGVRAPGGTRGVGWGFATGSDGMWAPSGARDVGSGSATGSDGMRVPGGARGVGSGSVAGLGHGGGRPDDRGGDEPFADGRGLAADADRRRARRTGGRGRGRAPVRLVARGAGPANTPTEGGR